MFIVLCVYGGTNTLAKFCLKLICTTTEIDKILKIAFSANAIWRTQAREWFSQVKRGNSSKILNIQAGPPQVTEMKTLMKFTKSLLNTGGRDYHFADRLGLLHATSQLI